MVHAEHYYNTINQEGTMTPIQRILSVLNTLKRTEQRLEDHDIAHAEITEQIHQIEADIHECMQSEDSPLATLVKAFEQLQRVQQYLHRATYASSGVGSMGWAHWFDDVSSAMELLSASEQTLRAEIAKRIGASLN
jgi:uncharacterized membrane protein YgaE (UPF0421/DUF939 family)